MNTQKIAQPHLVVDSTADLQLIANALKYYREENGIDTKEMETKIRNLRRKVIDAELGINTASADNTLLFDQNGRLIPTPAVTAVVTDPNKDYYFTQPVIDYKARLERLTDYFEVPITAKEFEKEWVVTPSSWKNVIYLPIVLPKATDKDYGTYLETLLTALEDSYTKQFPGRIFTNYCKDELKGQVTIVDKGHQKLWDKLQKEPVAAMYFPQALQGYSVHAQRQAAGQGFSLCGLETIVAAIMYPDVLLRDFYTPYMDLSALQWRSADDSLDVRAGGGGANFGDEGYLDLARGLYSGGLLFW